MSKPTILITGATGLVGSRTVLTALQAGHSVNITIRDPSQESLFLTTAAFKPYLANLSFHHVPNIAAPGAFSMAAKNATYMFHIASPNPMKSNVQALLEQGGSWREVLYDPAVNSTLEILRAAKETETVKRVVLVASGNILACTIPEEASADDATPTTIRKCPSAEEADAAANSGMAYKMSKILSTTAARDFMREHEGKLGFDLVIACPGYVQGRLEVCKSAEEISISTSRATLDIALGRPHGHPPLAPPVTSQIWVGDVARALVRCVAEDGRVGSNDILVLAGNGRNSAEWDEVARLIAEEWFPAEVRRGLFTPRRGQFSMRLPFDGRGTEEKLGWEFEGPEVWGREVLEQYLEFVR